MIAALFLVAALSLIIALYNCSILGMSYVYTRLGDLEPGAVQDKVNCVAVVTALVPISDGSGSF